MENNMFKLYYGKGIDLQNEIEEHYFKTKEELKEFIKKVYQNGMIEYGENIVYLFCDIDEDAEGEILVSQDVFSFFHYLDAYSFPDGVNVSLHEYQSFESAYSVALDMREPNKLCYDKH